MHIYINKYDLSNGRMAQEFCAELPYNFCVTFYKMQQQECI